MTTTFRFKDSDYATELGPMWARGEKGDPGEPGPQGPQGPAVPAVIYCHYDDDPDTPRPDTDGPVWWVGDPDIKPNFAVEGDVRWGEF